VEIIFWIIIALIVYTIAGYAFVLYLLASLFYRSKKFQKTYSGPLPEVTLLIPAYNEDKVISSKLFNALNLDYPKEKLHIIVASDGSTDQTNRIVASFQAQGVVLFAYPQRRGKISVINEAMKGVSDPIVVLSDANVMYEPQAIRTLVRHFEDPGVGVVSGNVSLIKTQSLVGKLDLIYQQYENWVKALETQTGSVTGADGAMYALRTVDYRPVGSHVILDDLVISMNSVRQGKRIVFEAEAKGEEHSHCSVKEGFWTRVRVVAGGIQALKQGIAMPTIKQPLLCFQFISHKVLRWLMPLQLLGLFVVNGFILNQGFYFTVFTLQAGFYSLALLAHLSGSTFLFLSGPYYWAIQNIGALLGIWRGLTDRQPVMWDKGERYLEKAVSEKH